MIAKRILGAIIDSAGLRRLTDSPEVAGGSVCPQWRWDPSMAHRTGFVALSAVQDADIGDRRGDVPPRPPAAAAAISGNLA